VFYFYQEAEFIITKVLAAIDIGSNTVQLILAKVSCGRVVSRSNQIRTTRLGETDCDGQLTPAAIAATAAAVKEFVRLSAAAGANRVRLIATAAVREAANRQDLLDALGKGCEQPLEILSGGAEARLSYRGAKSLLDFPYGTPVLDVGGASTELIYELAPGKIKAVSAPVGAVRARKAGWDAAAIREELAARLTALQPSEMAVGIGGTITTAAGIAAGCREYDRAAMEGVILSRQALQSLLDKLLPLSVAERCSFSPLLARRGEIMVEGLQIWLALADILDWKKIMVCSGGILDGAIFDMV
jgi:exopolyphosphatase / guanosine-5'-triphosphate,3'-diphosphate pyrophosphatase